MRDAAREPELGLRTDADRRAFAGSVLEQMSQDSGPASCEPFTTWCVQLANDVIDTLDERGD
jgi:hypothetical protein